MLRHSFILAIGIFVAPHLASGRVLVRPAPATDEPNLPLSASQKQPDLEKLIEEAEKEEYTIRRVEYCCYLRTPLSVLNEKSLLVEGDLFTRRQLERGLKSLGGLKTVRPIRLQDVEVHLLREYKEIDIVINIKEKRHRRWQRRITSARAS